MFDLPWYAYLGVLAAGVAAGYINTLAGSGSLITLPLLIFLGLPPTVANGTNRIGVLFQTITATVSFQRQKVLAWRNAIYLIVPSILGALVGAQIAANLNEEVMRRTIGVLMLVMLGVLFVEPKRWLVGRPEAREKRPSLAQLLLFFGIGIYGGFIQAGVGIFLLAGLVLSVGHDLVSANAVKSLIVLGFTIAALLVFILNDQVNWVMGALLAIGNGFGGWIAARSAVKRGATYVRWLLIAVVIVSSLNLLGVFQLIGRLFR